MSGPNQHNFYHHENVNRAALNQNIVTSQGDSAPSQLTSQQNPSTDPLHSMLYHIHSNPKQHKNYTFGDPSFTFQQMYQQQNQNDCYNNEYSAIINPSPLPTNHNISSSLDSQGQAVVLPQNQYSNVSLPFQPATSTIENAQHRISNVSNSSPSTDQHLRNSSTSTKHLVLELQDYNKPIKPRIATTFWEDEKTVCYQVEAHGIFVSRREDTNYVNGTKLLNVAGMTRGRRDGILKTEKNKSVIKIGAMNLKGVWIPFDRAAEIARNEGIDGLLYPLFVKNLKNFFKEKGSSLKHDEYLKYLSDEHLPNVSMTHFDESVDSDVSKKEEQPIAITKIA